jgi:large subunit ribosomal protein L23
MSLKDPYKIIKHEHVTEKATMLQGLKNAESNICLKRCTSPKYVFVVDTAATKRDIAAALEEIYKERNIKVVKVNTINIKGKERRVKGRLGMRPSIRKAIVTLEENDSLEDV